MPEDIEDIIEELEDAKCEIHIAYQAHLDKLEQLKDSYPIGFESTFNELRQRIVDERDGIIDTLDKMITDYQKK